MTSRKEFGKLGADEKERFARVLSPETLDEGGEGPNPRKKNRGKITEKWMQKRIKGGARRKGW